MDLATISAAARDLTVQGRLAEAEPLFRHVLRENPREHVSAAELGMNLMAQGRFAEGAALYEARLANSLRPSLPYPQWSGEPLDGKQVLIWPEQGLGDQIMCARFALTLKARGCDVTLVCSPVLHRLFAQSLPVRVLPASGGIEFPDPDVWLWAMSLMAAIGEPGIAAPPYLDAEAAPVPFRIGIAARGSPTNANDAHRSLPPDVAAELLALPDAGSLLPEHTGAIDMLETARIVAGLDLVVTVDTSIAHLAGAMGKPVWILLPAIGVDWRWLRDRTDTPWYASARLLRQEAPGAWTSVLDRVRSAIHSRADP